MFLPIPAFLLAAASTDAVASMRQVEVAGLSEASRGDVLTAIHACHTATKVSPVNGQMLIDQGWTIYSQSVGKVNSTGVSSRVFEHRDSRSRLVLVQPMFADACQVISRMTVRGIAAMPTTLRPGPIDRDWSTRWNGRLVNISIEKTEEGAVEAPDTMIVRTTLVRLPEGLK